MRWTTKSDRAKRREKEARDLEEAKYMTRWHPWFAFWPVCVCSGDVCQWYWLEPLQRKGKYVETIWGETLQWEYKLPETD